MATQTNNSNAPTETDIAHMQARIGALKEKVRNSDLKAKEGYQSQVQALEDRYELMKTRFQKFSKQGKDVANEAKQGLSSAWSELTEAINKASDRIH